MRPSVRNTLARVLPLLLNYLRIALTGLTFTAPADAQPARPSTAIDSVQFRGMQWRSIGPNRGGRSTAVAGSTRRPLEYYFGAVGGGLWKTTDGGQSWKPVTDGQLRSSSVGAVAVAESNPDVVYIGMGETCIRGNIMQGDGVYRSIDGGKTWKHLGLDATQAIAKIRVDPRNPDIAYVAAFGHPAGHNAERGVYKTIDGGRSWRKVLYRNDQSGAIDLSMDAHDPNVLYAALWEAYRITWQMSSGGPGSGLFKSTDGGDHWTEITRAPGLPTGVIGRIGVSVSPVDGRRVYAVVEAGDGGVYRSDDAGATWTRTSEERKLRQRAFYYTHVTADPQVRDRVYVLNVSFFRSDDGGVRFDSALTVPHGDNHDLWIAPNDNGRMIEANDGGGTVSVNAGRTWTDETAPTAQLYHVATTRDVPYHVCGAQQDNTTACLPSNGWANIRGARSRTLGDWMYDVGGGESGYIAPDPRDANLFYAGSQGALLTRYNRANGQIRDVQVSPRFFSGEPASVLPERWQWTFPIVFAPTDPRTLYTSSQHLWRTRDEGQTWTRISPDLTRADPATLGPSGGPITGDMNGPEIYGTIFTVAPSPVDGHVIWTGSDDGRVHITRDDGRTWADVTPLGLPKFARVSLIDASHRAPGTAYLAANNYLLDDRAPYLYRTHDFGRTWTRIVSGIRADDYAHAVREDPARAGLLYAGTEHGIYVSWDDGGTWQSLSLKLPDTQVSDLVVQGSDLVIATHGRSMYVLDDLTPIREARSTPTALGLQLFTPRTATRGVDSATVQYALARPAATVRVEILDHVGTVVRTYVGGGQRTADSSAVRDTAGQPSGCEPPRRHAAAVPAGRAGLNRFTWDLRYPGATTFPCLVIWSATPEEGPLAVPGAYQVRVTADGATETRPIRVRADPRLVGVTPADMRAQFELATQIRDRVSAAHEAVLRIRRVRDQAGGRLTNATAAELTAIEQTLYQVRNRSGQDPLNFPIQLNNRLAALGQSVETGDARPTAAAYVVFRQLSAELDVALRHLDRVIASDAVARTAAVDHTRDTVVLRAAHVLDGAGGRLPNSDVAVADGRIIAVRPARGPLPPNGIDLGPQTLLPGFIDTHVHLSWYVNASGRLHTPADGDSPDVQARAGAANALATLRAGFTTVQSVGEPENRALRDGIARGTIPGPRVLTSLGAVTEQTGGGSPDSLRAAVHRFRDDGADLIKIFASKSIRDGGTATMSDAQLAAACGEAHTLGLRTLVHAHSAESVSRAARAGCTQVEHGVFADDAARQLLVAHGTYFDPQCGLVFRNYLDHKPVFEGIGNYNATGFAAMERAIPLAERGIRDAVATPGLQLVFGTDAVAGAHGRNAEELVCRVRRGGEPAMDAVVSATSRAARSLGLGDQIGQVRPGFAADLIATAGDPSTEIEASQRVVFVMRAGRVARRDSSAATR